MFTDAIMFTIAPILWSPRYLLSIGNCCLMMVKASIISQPSIWIQLWVAVGHDGSKLGRDRHIVGKNKDKLEAAGISNFASNHDTLQVHLISSACCFPYTSQIS